MVRWINSNDVKNWGDPGFKVTPSPSVQLMTLSDWLGKNNQQKFELMMKEVAVRPIPGGGCTSLNEDLVAATTTTAALTTTAAPTTTAAKLTITPAAKQTTIRCVNGKITKLVQGIKPKCPSGYSKK